jgi:hypothetical protein
MMLFRAIVLWTVQVLLFGIGTAGLLAHLFGPIIGQAFAIDELIPTALIFFTAAAALGWFGNRFWPEDWMHNPLL